MISFKQTDFGFQWGGLEIIRLFSDQKRGWVTIGIKTDHHDIQVYVTKTGKVAINSEGTGKTGWKPPKMKRGEIK